MLLYSIANSPGFQMFCSLARDMLSLNFIDYFLSSVDNFPARFGYLLLAGLLSITSDVTRRTGYFKTSSFKISGAKKSPKRSFRLSYSNLLKYLIYPIYFFYLIYPIYFFYLISPIYFISFTYSFAQLKNLLLHIHHFLYQFHSP